MASATTSYIRRRITERRFVLTVEPVVFLCTYVLAQSAVLTDLVIRQSCRSLNMTVENCTRTNYVDVEVHRLSSTFSMWKTILGTATPSVISLFVGPWSNVNGRKPALIVSVFSEMSSQGILMGLSNIENIHPYWLLTSQVPALVTGGFATVALTAYAYLIDVSVPESRSFRMSILSAMFTASAFIANFVVTPLQGLGYTTFYGITTGVNFINLLYVIFLLPESVEVDQGKKTSALNLNNFKLSCKTYFKDRPNHSRGIIFSLTIAVCLLVMVNAGEDGVQFLSTMKKFGWGIAEFSNYNIVSYVFNAVGILGCVYVGDIILKINEIVICITVIALSVIGSFLIDVAPTPTAFYILTQLRCACGSICPLVRGYIAKILPGSDVVNVINCLGALELVQPIIGAFLYSRVYNAAVSYNPFVIYCLSGGLFMGCLTFAVHGLIMHLMDKNCQVKVNEDQEDFQCHIEDSNTAMEKDVQ